MPSKKNPDSLDVCRGSFMRFRKSAKLALLARERFVDAHKPWLSDVAKGADNAESFAQRRELLATATLESVHCHEELGLVGLESLFAGRVVTRRIISHDLLHLSH